MFKTTATAMPKKTSSKLLWQCLSGGLKKRGGNGEGAIFK
jgi:hypothetical protein